jgi:hypothetical protein
LRSIEPLRRIFIGQENIIFVDNETVFKDAPEKESYKEYFRDMFAGDFGHCTVKGNRFFSRKYRKCYIKRGFWEIKMVNYGTI